MALVLREGVGGGPSSNETDILVPRLAGRAKSLVRLPVAVDPSTPPDQAFNIDGHACQVYHLTERVRFVTALVPGDGESWPRGQAVLRVAMGEGAAPAEAGTFPSIDLSAMEFILTIDGTQFRARPMEAIHEDKVAPIGPGHRNQTGPDLLRRKHYVLALKRQSIGNDPGTETQDYVTVADLHVTTRVDMELAVVEILWMAGRWKSTNNPYQSNPSCGGPVYFDHVRVTRASLPAGWGVELFTTTPYSHVTGDNVMGISAMAGPTEVHWIPSTGQCSFRFAVYNPATVSQSTARKVLDGWDRGFAVSGPLSYHQQRAYGERLDVLLDLQHFRQGTQGEEIQFSFPGQVSPDIWRSHEDRAQNAATLLRQDMALAGHGKRFGWGFQTLPRGTYGPGGGGIYGASVAYQARAYYEFITRRLDALVTRTHLAMIDIVDGRCLNDTKLVTNNSSSWTDLYGATPGAQGFLPFYTNAGQQTSAWVHPHFVHAYANVDHRKGNSPSAIADQFRLAPSNRPWNTPPAGKSCPYQVHMDWQLSSDIEMEPFMTSHSSRYLTELRDCLWLYDDPIAHRVLEEIVCSRNMLAMSRYDVRSPFGNNFDRAVAVMPYAVSSNNLPQRWGAWRTPQQATHESIQGDNLRAFAWPMTMAVMYWHVATPAERARIHGPLSGGPAASWFRSWWDWADAVFMDSGLGLRTDTGNLAPNPFDPGTFGAPDVTNRRGAYPRVVGAQSPNRASCVSIFHVAFTTGAIFACKNGPLADDFVNKERLNRNLHVARVLRAHAERNYPSGDYKGITYDILCGPTGNTLIQGPPLSIAQHEAGESRWTLTQIANSSVPPGTPLESRNFVGWCSLYGLRDTGDPAMLNALAGDKSVPASNWNGLFFALENELRAKWGVDDDFRNKLPLDDHTWWSGVLAELVYLRNVVPQ